MAGSHEEGEAGRLLHQKRGCRGAPAGGKRRRRDALACWKNDLLKTYVCFANTLQYFLGVLCCVVSASPSLLFVRARPSASPFSLQTLEGPVWSFFP